MRRRFGRRRWRGGNESEDGTARPPVGVSWLARIAEAGLAGVSRLDPVRFEDVPDWLCVTGVGEGAGGEKVIVAFAPGSGLAALLGAVVTGARLAAEPGFRGRVLAVAPAWREIDRRLLGLVTALPLELRALAAAGLGDETAVEGEPQAASLAVPPELAGAALATPAERARFERGLAALRGLAAKHGGVVRGGDAAADLVLQARPVASLRAGLDGAVLEVIEPARASYRLAYEDLADVLDRLEGQLRKFLSDRTIRDGEEGLRGRAWARLAEASGARGVRAWPAGDECEAVDFVAVDAEGAPLVGAARRRLDLGALAGVLEAALRLEPLFGALLADAPPPVRLGAPSLALAGAETSAAVDLVLRHLGLASRCFALRETSSGVELTPRGVAAAAAAVPVARLAPPPPAPREARPPGEAARYEARPPREAAPYEAPPRDAQPPRDERAFPPAPREDEDESDEGEELAESAAAAPGEGAAPGRRRRRRRGRRGRREEPEGEALRERAGADRSESPVARERAAEERAESPPAAAPAPRPFLEMSLFDLDEEGGEAGESRGRRRRRRGGRGRRDREGAEPGASDDEPEPAAEEVGARAAPRALAEVPDDEDADALLELSPDAPDLEEPEPQYEEGDLEEAPLTESERLRNERERRRAAAAPATPHAAEDGAVPEGAESEPELPRGRAAILAHADRASILGALLLAREVRTIEGLWIYPQSELMTFFRGVATDLRPNTPIYVVGFEAKPSHDALQAAALYRGRLAWFDHHDWPPEDLHAMRQALGANVVHVTPGTESSLPAVLALCGRRSRFTDKLVDLVTGSFTQHDWERWGRLWWHRLGELGKRPGEHRPALDALLAGRPSDLAREASRAPAPPLPAEAEFVASRDFRLVHFGGYAMVVSDVPAGLDAPLSARILRERFGAALSLVRSEGSATCVLGASEVSGRALDVGSMVEHLAEKLDWVEALSDADHVARFRIRDLARRPERLDEAVAEIGMSRSVLEG